MSPSPSLSLWKLLLLGALAAGCATSSRSLSGTLQERFPALERRASGLEVVARLVPVPPGNVAVTPEGRIFLSQHPFGAPQYKVVELLPDGTTMPYPNATLSGGAGGAGVGLQTVIGIEADRNGVLWMLDNGKGAGEGSKLMGWDTRKEELVYNIPLRAGAAPNSFIQDLVVDPGRGVAVLADMGRGDLTGPSMPALIVVDLKRSQVRRVLQGHPSLDPEDVSMVVQGQTVTAPTALGLHVPPRLGLNPITLDPQGEWVYYGSMTGRTVWRVPLKDLVDASLSAEALGARVQRHGEKAVSDGISIDSAGNVYVTDLGASAIGVTKPDGSYSLHVKDELLSWPDGMSYGPDGYFYVTVNQLHRHALLNQGVAAVQPPFLLVRFRPLAPGEVGR